MKNILINGIAANSGGGKSILSNFLSILREKNSSYCFIILVPTISDYSIYSSRNIKIIEIPKVSGLLHLLIFYYSSINKIIVKYKIDLVFNLADVIIPNKEIKQLFLFDWAYAVYPNSIVWKKMDFKSFVLRRIKVFMFKKYSYYPKVIYCQTNSIRNRLGKYYSTQKLDIIPNAVAIDNMGGGEYKNFNFLENKKKFLCLSKYYSHKNLEIFKKATEDITVVLEGQGADELLAGYLNNVESIYLIELIRKFRFKKAIIELNEYCKVYSLSSLVMLFVRQLNSGWIHKLYYKVSGVSAFYIGHLSKYKHIKDSPRKAKGFDCSVNAHLFKSHTGGLVNLLHYGDAISMAYSLESRLPFMDYRLVEYVFSLPSEFKICNGQSKYIHRKAMEGVVADEILSQKVKFGFSTPLTNMFLEKGHNSAASILLSKRCIDRGLFSEKGIQKSLKDLERGTKDRSRFLYRMLNVELWFREFIDK
ncbi:MAG: asparagine synthase-related protein [Saprospiraceae bacterium]|nr:asparagine synthase-related protein [Saprospiraceae bacterium]